MSAPKPPRFPELLRTLVPRSDAQEPRTKGSPIKEQKPTQGEKQEGKEKHGRWPEAALVAAESVDGGGSDYKGYAMLWRLTVFVEIDP
jgi:hypothetical protein